MSEQNKLPYCDFFKHHDNDFNYGLCPCGDSVVIDGELRCTRTKAKTKKYEKGISIC